jgi:hypothetical protein
LHFLDLQQIGFRLLEASQPGGGLSPCQFRSGLWRSTK